ncbi:hypothetical protein BD309DRAFT_948093 [Dichomitus squalens]|uniref:Uncharacterized protein n=1 Tax=Dichomitus squalens TaxID=114155 RepID=A0A4Q9P8I8_9APHY|nr:hypothetical protein BD311DRAFT_12804 [Dichomitus squalens]TBU49101.1 hypothetical protein BD309DRAFT_948093 [Dichomitus squalens]
MSSTDHQDCLLLLLTALSPLRRSCRSPLGFPPGLYRFSNTESRHDRRSCIYSHLLAKFFDQPSQHPPQNCLAH